MSMMPSDVLESVETPALFFPSPQRAAMFLDIDGTLLNFASHPADVVADAELIRLITEIYLATDGAVAFVSGRGVADIDRIFAPLTLPAAGLHGGEIRFPDGSIRCAPSTMPNHIRLELQSFVRAHPGLLLEDKGATIAIHYRHRAEIADLVCACMRRFEAPGERMVLEGKFVTELKPVDFDKGAAIAELLDHAPFAHRLPVFIGDDSTDEHGFAFVNSVAGLSVRVDETSAPTCAQLRVETPEALRAILTMFAGAGVNADATS